MAVDPIARLRQVAKQTDDPLARLRRIAGKAAEVKPAPDKVVASAAVAPIVEPVVKPPEPDKVAPVAAPAPTYKYTTDDVTLAIRGSSSNLLREIILDKGNRDLATALEAVAALTNLFKPRALGILESFNGVDLELEVKDAITTAKRGLVHVEAPADDASIAEPISTPIEAAPTYRYTERSADTVSTETLKAIILERENRSTETALKAVDKIKKFDISLVPVILKQVIEDPRFANLEKSVSDAINAAMTPSKYKDADVERAARESNLEMLARFVTEHRSYGDHQALEAVHALEDLGVAGNQGALRTLRHLRMDREVSLNRNSTVTKAIFDAMERIVKATHYTEENVREAVERRTFSALSAIILGEARPREESVALAAIDALKENTPIEAALRELRKVKTDARFSELSGTVRVHVDWAITDLEKVGGEIAGLVLAGAETAEAASRETHADIIARTEELEPMLAYAKMEVVGQTKADAKLAIDKIKGLEASFLDTDAVLLEVAEHYKGKNTELAGYARAAYLEITTVPRIYQMEGAQVLVSLYSVTTDARRREILDFLVEESDREALKDIYMNAFGDLEEPVTQAISTLDLNLIRKAEREVSEGNEESIQVLYNSARASPYPLSQANAKEAIAALERLARVDALRNGIIDQLDRLIRYPTVDTPELTECARAAHARLTATAEAPARLRPPISDDPTYREALDLLAENDPTSDTRAHTRALRLEREGHYTEAADIYERLGHNDEAERIRGRLAERPLPGMVPLRPPTVAPPPAWRPPAFEDSSEDPFGDSLEGTRPPAFVEPERPPPIVIEPGPTFGSALKLDDEYARSGSDPLVRSFERAGDAERAAILDLFTRKKDRSALVACMGTVYMRDTEQEKAIRRKIEEVDDEKIKELESACASDAEALTHLSEYATKDNYEHISRSTNKLAIDALERLEALEKLNAIVKVVSIEAPIAEYASTAFDRVFVKVMEKVESDIKSRDEVRFADGIARLRELNERYPTSVRPHLNRILLTFPAEERQVILGKIVTAEDIRKAARDTNTEYLADVATNIHVETELRYGALRSLVAIADRHPDADAKAQAVRAIGNVLEKCDIDMFNDGLRELDRIKNGLMTNREVLVVAAQVFIDVALNASVSKDAKRPKIVESLYESCRHTGINRDELDLFSTALANIAAEYEYAYDKLEALFNDARDADRKDVILTQLERVSETAVLSTVQDRASEFLASLYEGELARIFDRHLSRKERRKANRGLILRRNIAAWAKTVNLDYDRMAASSSYEIAPSPVDRKRTLGRALGIAQEFPSAELLIDLPVATEQINSTNHEKRVEAAREFKRIARKVPEGWRKAIQNMLLNAAKEERNAIAFEIVKTIGAIGDIDAIEALNGLKGQRAVAPSAIDNAINKIEKRLTKENAGGSFYAKRAAFAAYGTEATVLATSMLAGATVHPAIGIAVAVVGSVIPAMALRIGKRNYNKEHKPKKGDKSAAA